MTAYGKGSAAEREYHRIKEAEGWVVGGSLGSKGVFDRICVRAGRIMLVEVKATKRGPYAGFPPDVRAALLRAATRAGAEAVLAWKEPYKEFKEIPSSEWP